MKKIGVLILSLLIALMLALPNNVMGNSPNGAPEVERLSGVNRYETSAKIAQTGWSTSQYVILATGENYPDALCAAPLATHLNAPVLLTAKDSLSSETENEIDRLGVKTAYIIGGFGVVSMNVNKQLEAKNINVRRLYGENRFQTSSYVANQMKDQMTPLSKIFLVTGYDFSDAVFASSYAAKKGIPIVLVPKDYEDNYLRLTGYLDIDRHTQTYVLGGLNEISWDVFSHYPNFSAIGGSDKYERNLSFTSIFSDELDFTTTYIATGDDFPDALTGAALAAQDSSPVLLIGKELAPFTETILRKHAGSIKKLRVLGGEGAVSNDVIQKIKDIVRNN
ncbi:cell wall-binding repeat-containing protein [Desulfitobacterium sp. Sab5]|uniref:cell wall-binding repeat-containing protein n=1 Tax=Desulfitobacterium nosdiversum TaxID=3375356 RepID=UPI003CF817CC